MTRIAPEPATADPVQAMPQFRLKSLFLPKPVNCMEYTHVARNKFVGRSTVPV